MQKRKLRNYLLVDIFTLHYPYNKELECSVGKTISYDDVKKYEFQHSLSIKEGSSGAPVISFDKIYKEIKVIGIHRSFWFRGIHKYNIGTFIDIFVDKLNEQK